MSGRIGSSLVRPLWPRRRRRAALLCAGCLAGLFLLTSCLSIPVPGRGQERTAESLGWKVVIEKHEPNLLLSVDRSFCEVGNDRFERVQEGDRVFCHWRRSM